MLQSIVRARGFASLESRKVTAAFDGVVNLSEETAQRQ